MDLYEEEMYKFLTQRENFESMAKVIQSYDAIKKQLLTEFWNLVGNKIKDLNQKNDNKWSLLTPPNLFSTYARIMLYKSSWTTSETSPPFGIAWERLTSSTHYYGVWLNSDSKIIDTRRIKEHFKTLDITTSEFQTDSNSYWAFWDDGRFNVDKSTELIAILPESRTEIVDEYAKMLFALANRIESDLDKGLQFKK